MRLLWAVWARLKPSPGYAAAAALVFIQVSIGLLYKAAQKDGKYSFSQSAAIAISEFFKLLIAAVFFYREWQRREEAHGYELGSTDSPRPSTESKRDYEAGSSHNGLLERANGSGGLKYAGLPQTGWQGKLHGYVNAVKAEIPLESFIGFSQLALFYALINNLIFVLYKLADPGTIQLIRSGVTLITALVMLVFLKRKIVGIQWVAIVLQLCGLVVTQYKPGGATYSFTTYSMILFQTFLSAVAGVYNETLNKATNSSLHADNMALYTGGVVVNTLIHIVMKLTHDDEPNFFDGFDSWGAVMVVVSNIFIGLAITAVYKYSDAVIKCFATSIATGILLYIAPLLFNTDFGFLVLPGTLVVFIATWMYVKFTPPPARPGQGPTPPSQPSLMSKIFQVIAIKLRLSGNSNPASKFSSLAIKLAVTIFIIAATSKVKDHRPTVTIANHPGFKIVPTPSGVKPGPEHPVDSVNATGIESPFKNTLAFIRWNNPHPQRIPYLMKYKPFFKDIHISLPKYTEGNNLTADGWENAFQVYGAVADTMEHVLLHEPDIEGLFFFHFDMWIDPLGFMDLDREKIWFPQSDNPRTHCTDKNVKLVKWWGFERGFHKGLVAAGRTLDDLKLGYNFGKYGPETVCLGWSDIYFIPRKYFRDYILISSVMLRTAVFHEIGIPTMLHIIDNTRRTSPFRSEILRIGDCWGNCCTEHPPIWEVETRRCGHKLDYRQDDLVKAHYDNLERRRQMLGKKVEEVKETDWKVYSEAKGGVMRVSDNPKREL